MLRALGGAPLNANVGRLRMIAEMMGPKTTTIRILLTCMLTIATPAIALATDVSEKSVSAMKTPYGTVKIVRSSITLQLDTVTVNGKSVFQECCWIGLYGRFRLPDGVAVLVGVNATGSATPWNDDYYVVLKADSAPVVMTDDEFLARYRCKRKSAQSLSATCALIQ